MAKQPTIIFELEIAPLLPKETQGVSGQQIASGLKDLLEPERVKELIDQQVVPLGLRWRGRPELGLPRMPFAVWRRDRRKGDPFDFKFDKNDLPGLQLIPGKFRLPNAPVYILGLIIDNNSSSNLIVKALNTDHNPLFLQTVGIPGNTSREVRFQHPFIGGFSCEGGNFQIKSIVGVSMQHYIDLDDWELIEVVGLPAEKGEISGYDSEEQGFPSQLKPPPDAALDRLAIAQQFYQDLPTTLPTGENLPLWEIPKPQTALEELRDGAPPLLERLSTMFKAVDTNEVASQEEFRVKIEGPGIHQPEFPDQATEDVTFDIPLLASFLLNSTADSWFALSSGFGTTDFPEFVEKDRRQVLEPNSYFNVSHDYMVSSIFHYHFFGVLDIKQEYCALSHRSPLPAFSANGLESDIYAQNRPPERDDTYSAEIALTWLRLNPFHIQGYAIAVAENSTNGRYLNSLRSIKSTLPALFMPTIPGPEGDPFLQTHNRFIHHQAPLPFTGVEQNRYGLAAMDAFGRWSDWRTTQQALTAPQPQAARLMALSLDPETSPASENPVGHKLTVEIAWDWQDRSPKRFQLAAVFHRRLYLADGTKDNGHLPPENYPAVFQTNNAAASDALLEFIFPSDSTPGTPPAFEALPTCSDPRVDLELLPQSTNEQGQVMEGEMRRYRATMTGLDLNFEADEEWFFTLFLKAAEWRNPAALSDSVLPLLPGRPRRMTTYVPNPIPPPPPVFNPATVIWSSLQDARGKSRYRLAFDPIPSATGGYAVFQAFETKLRDLVELPLSSDADLIGRATDLRDLVMPDVRSLDAFGRLNTTLIPPPVAGAQVEYEVEIPGTLDGLVVFAVASVSREQETSPLSTPWLMVAVPRRSVPASPILSLVQQNGSTHLSCTFAKGPFKPEKVELMRVRQEFPSRSIDTMGPAVHSSSEPAWEAVDEQGKTTANEEAIAQFRFSHTDPTPPSWFPYYYRAIATGPLNEQLGLKPGRSTQSNLITIEQLPKNLPLVEDLIGDQVDSRNIRLEFTSDAPVESTPHGAFRLELFSWDFSQNIFLETPVLDLFLAKANEIPADNSLVKGELYYSTADPAGKRRFVTLLSLAGDRYVYRLRLTDPLTRRSERMLSGKVKANDPPHLANLKVRRRGRDLSVFFESSTTVQRPPFGGYMLEISTVAFFGRGAGLLEKVALHKIRIGDLRRLERSNTKVILRERKGGPTKRTRYGAFFPDVLSSSFFFRRGRLRVRLIAPDGASVLLEQNVN